MNSSKLIIVLNVWLGLLFVSPFGFSAEPDSVMNLANFDHRQESLSFRLGDQFDFAKAGAIEFWVGHSVGPNNAPELQKDVAYKGDRHDARRPNGFKSGTNGFFYTVLMAFGDPKDPALIVYLADGQPDGYSRIGAATSWSQIEQQSRQIQLSDYDSTRDGFLRPVPEYYHVVLRNDGNAVSIYVNGIRTARRIPANWKSLRQSQIHIGGDFGPHTTDIASRTVSQAVRFQGVLGGVRLWSASLSGEDIQKMRAFGRNCRAEELAMTPAYGGLAYFADFTKKEKSLYPADRFGGSWRNKFATVKQTPNGTFIDYPVYTFIPAGDPPVFRYQAFEDDNFIGELVHLEKEHWALKHLDGAEFRFSMTDQHTLTCQEIPARLGGVEKGKLILQRATLTSPVFQQALSKLEENRIKAEANDLAVFLLDKTVQNGHYIYNGYNLSKVGIDLSQNGNGDRAGYGRVFQLAEQHFHVVDDNTQKVLPVELLEYKTEHNRSKAMNREIWNRAEDRLNHAVLKLGAGVNTSVGASASFGGFGGSVNVSTHIVGQYEDVLENAELHSTGTSKMVEVEYAREFRVFHKREYTRLDSLFRERVADLYEECNQSNGTQRDEAIFRFFREYGTHYVFGATYGWMKYSQSTLDESKSSESRKEMTEFFLSINDGKSGASGTDKLSVTKLFKKEQSKSIQIGKQDKFAPINIDARPIIGLFSPQYFRRQPGIYTDLHRWVSEAYPRYLKHEFETSFQTAESEAKDEKSREQVKRYKKDLDNFERTGNWAIKPKTSAFAFRLNGVKLRHLKLKENAKWNAYDKYFYPPLSVYETAKTPQSFQVFGEITIAAGNTQNWLSNQPRKSIGELFEGKIAFPKVSTFNGPRKVTIWKSTESSPVRLKHDTYSRDVKGGVFKFEVPEKGDEFALLDWTMRSILGKFEAQMGLHARGPNGDVLRPRKPGLTLLEVMELDNHESKAAVRKSWARIKRKFNVSPPHGVSNIFWVSKRPLPKTVSDALLFPKAAQKEYVIPALPKLRYEGRKKHTIYLAAPSGSDLVELEFDFDLVRTPSLQKLIEQGPKLDVAGVSEISLGAQQGADNVLMNRSTETFRYARSPRTTLPESILSVVSQHARDSAHYARPSVIRCGGSDYLTAKGFNALGHSRAPDRNWLFLPLGSPERDARDEFCWLIYHRVARKVLATSTTRNGTHGFEIELVDFDPKNSGQRWRRKSSQQPPIVRLYNQRQADEKDTVLFYRGGAFWNVHFSNEAYTNTYMQTSMTPAPIYDFSRRDLTIPQAVLDVWDDRYHNSDAGYLSQRFSFGVSAGRQRYIAVHPLDQIRADSEMDRGWMFLPIRMNDSGQHWLILHQPSGLVLSVLHGDATVQALHRNPPKGKHNWVRIRDRWVNPIQIWKAEDGGRKFKNAGTGNYLKKLTNDGEHVLFTGARDESPALSIWPAGQEDGEGVLLFDPMIGRLPPPESDRAVSVQP